MKVSLLPGYKFKIKTFTPYDFRKHISINFVNAILLFNFGVAAFREELI